MKHDVLFMLVRITVLRITKSMYNMEGNMVEVVYASQEKIDSYNRVNDTIYII